MELCKEVQQLRPDMKIRHGGTGGAPFKPKNRPTPMKILKNYIEDNKMRLLDLFNTLDKDKSMNITVKEFADGLKVRSLSDLFSNMDCRCILANRTTCISKFGHVQSHSHR